MSVVEFVQLGVIFVEIKMTTTTSITTIMTTTTKQYQQNSRLYVEPAPHGTLVSVLEPGFRVPDLSCAENLLVSPFKPI